jgi:AcrR family transcriptional regulator
VKNDEQCRLSNVIGRRRRGVELEDAICQAAFTELTEVGYAAFTIESVAARSGTGKASIYRRWDTKDKLLVDAFCRGVPTPTDCFFAAELDDSVTTREALIASARAMVAGMSGEKNAAVRAIASEAARDPELGRAVEREVLAPRRAGLIELFNRGIARGEVLPDAPIDIIAELMQSVFMTRVLFRQVDIHDDAADRLIDEVAMPLLTGEPRASDRPRILIVS